MSKKILTNADFHNGLAKLVDNVKRSLMPDENGRTDPFIHIPEEFDPRFPVVMSSLTTVVNNSDIYGLYMNDLHNEALAFEEEKGFLIGGIADDSVTRDEMMRMISCNNKFVTSVLCTELFKELYDALFYVAYNLSKEVISIINDNEQYNYHERMVFRRLVDIDNEIGLKQIFQDQIVANVNAAKNTFISDYSMFTYVWYLRGILVTGVSDHWYNVIREFDYTIFKKIDTPIENVFRGNDVAVTLYLYILDNVFNVILTSFQSKVQFCYSNSFALEKQLKDGTFGKDDEFESENQ